MDHLIQNICLSYPTLGPKNLDIYTSVIGWEQLPEDIDYHYLLCLQLKKAFHSMKALI
jgi:hypothetical protein